ncbi:hypothetical protein B0H19DRAFT_524990 [Mycena capillaripes]|nr:hypothetical protein B0H19DRAFT_524990 [Mycena capillaripes]
MISESITDTHSTNLHPILFQFSFIRSLCVTGAVRPAIQARPSSMCARAHTTSCTLRVSTRRCACVPPSPPPASAARATVVPQAPQVSSPVPLVSPPRSPRAPGHICASPPRHTIHTPPALYCPRPAYHLPMRRRVQLLIILQSKPVSSCPAASTTRSIAGARSKYGERSSSRAPLVSPPPRAARVTAPRVHLGTSAHLQLGTHPPPAFYRPRRTAAHTSPRAATVSSASQSSTRCRITGARSAGHGRSSASSPVPLVSPLRAPPRPLRLRRRPLQPSACRAPRIRLALPVATLWPSFHCRTHRVRFHSQHHTAARLSTTHTLITVAGGRHAPRGTATNLRTTPSLCGDAPNISQNLKTHSPQTSPDARPTPRQHSTNAPINDAVVCAPGNRKFESAGRRTRTRRRPHPHRHPRPAYAPTPAPAPTRARPATQADEGRAGHAKTAH